MVARTPKAPVVKAAPAAKAAPARNPKADRTRRVQNARAATVIESFKQAHTFALTAAASALDGAAGEMAQPNSQTRTWQHSVWGYGRSIPELNAAMMYVGNCMSRVKIEVGKREADGTVSEAFDGAEPAEGLDPKLLDMAQEVMRSYRSPTGGQSELNRSYGEKMFMVGELYLLPEENPWGMTFDVLSTQELFKEGNGYVRYLGPGYENIPIPEGIIPIRIWRKDPQFGILASSSVRSCLEVAEELLILTRLVRSAAISRMALAGILAIADEFDSPLEEVGPDGDSAENTNPLLVDMINAGSKAIDDPASAAAYMPYLLQGPLELIQNGLKYITFNTDDSIHVVKRQEAIERLAHGLDLPREAVIGHLDTTFSNAFQISEDTFNIHIEPTVQMLCDALTLYVLWPGMALKLGVTADQVKERGFPPEVLDFAVSYDASELVSRIDRTKDIISVYTGDETQMTIGISEMRLALGLSADGAPDDAEVAKRIEAVRLTKTRPDPAPIQADPITEPAIAADPAIGEGAVTAAAVMNRIAGAAEASIERAVDEVGKKLRAKINGARTEERTLVQGVPNGEVASRLGPLTVERLLGDTYPMDTEMAAFARTAARILDEAGMPHAGRTAAALTAAAASVAADRLFGTGARFDVEMTRQLLTVG